MKYSAGIGWTLAALLAAGVAALVITSGGSLQFKNGSGVVDVALTRNDAKQLALTDGVYTFAKFGAGSIDAFSTNELDGEDLTVRARDGATATTYDVPLSATPEDHTLSMSGIIFKTSSASGLKGGQRVTIAGFTPADWNGSYLVYPQSTTTFWVSNASEDPCTVVGTCTAVPAKDGGSITLQPGTATEGGTRGSVLMPGVAENSICIGHNASAPNATDTDVIAIGSYCSASGINGVAIGYGTSAVASTEWGEPMAIGPNSATDGDYACALGQYAYALADYTTAVGAGSCANITKTSNIAGIDVVQKYDEYKLDSLANNTARTVIIWGDPVSVTATSTVTKTMPTGIHVWVEEVGVIVSTFSLNGGTLTTQPTLSFGVTGDNDKHRVAEITTLLTAAYTRERYTTLLTDVGETSLTMQITVAATITGGTSPVYKVRPYWVVRAVEDEDE